MSQRAVDTGDPGIHDIDPLSVKFAGLFFDGSVVSRVAKSISQALSITPPEVVDTQQLSTTLRHSTVLGDSSVGGYQRFKLERRPGTSAGGSTAGMPLPSPAKPDLVRDRSLIAVGRPQVLYDPLNEAFVAASPPPYGLPSPVSRSTGSRRSAAHRPKSSASVRRRLQPGVGLPSLRRHGSHVTYGTGQSSPLRLSSGTSSFDFHIEALSHFPCTEQ